MVDIEKCKPAGMNNATLMGIVNKRFGIKQSEFPSNKAADLCRIAYEKDPVLFKEIFAHLYKDESETPMEETPITEEPIAPKSDWTAKLKESYRSEKGGMTKAQRKREDVLKCIVAHPQKTDDPLYAEEECKEQVDAEWRGKMSELELAQAKAKEKKAECKKERMKTDPEVGKLAAELKGKRAQLNALINMKCPI